jgi:integrase
MSNSNRKSSPSRGLGLHMRGNRWYIRVRVPRPALAYISKPSIVESCKTGDYKAATQYAMRRVAELREDFAIIGHQSDRAESLKQRTREERTAELLRQLAEFRTERLAGAISAQELEEAFDILVDQARDLTEDHTYTGPEGPDEPAGTPAQLAIADTIYRSLGAVTRPELTPLTDVLAEYLTEKEGRITQRVLQAKRTRIQRLADWAGEGAALGEINRRTAGAYTAHMQRTRCLEVSTARDELKTLSSFFRWAITRGYSDAMNPFEGQSDTLREDSRATSENTERCPWSSDELRLFFTQESHQDGGAHVILAALALYTGMRLSELCSIRVADVIDDVIKIREGKSKAAKRQVPVHPAIRNAVDRLQADSPDGWLIPGLTTGGPDGRRGSSMSSSFSKCKVRLGLPVTVTFHGLRKNFITQLVQHQVPIHEIQQLVGHENRTLVHGVYCDVVTIERLVEVVALVDYGDMVTAAVERAMEEGLTRRAEHNVQH